MNYEKLIRILPTAKKGGVNHPSRPSRRARFLKRRLSGGIRFWDLGYMLDGDSYINLPFLDPNHAGTIQSPGVFPIFDDLTIDFYDQMRDSVLAVPLEQWKTTFKQIDESYEDVGGSAVSLHYRGTTYNSAVSPDVWNGDRFLPNQVPTTDALIAQVNNSISMGVGVNFWTTKVTTEADYTADPVEFVPSKAMDIFLMPALISVGLSAYHDYTKNILGIVTYQELDALDMLRFLYPRDLFQDPNNFLYGVYLDASSFNWNRLSGGDDSLAMYEAVFNVVTHWRDNIGGLRARRSIAGTSVTPSQVDIDPQTDFAPLSLYPTPPTLPPDSKTVQLTAQFLSVLVGNVPNGTLLGVILKGGTYYYVWWDA